MTSVPVKVMRHGLGLVLLLVCCVCAEAQVRFEHTQRELGIVPEDTVHLPQCDFTFVNDGKTAVSLSRVKTSCGCLQADYDRRPVAPGKTGHVRITFDPAGHPGKFLRKVFVYFSGKSQPVVLHIKGTVVPAQRPGRQFLCL